MSAAVATAGLAVTGCGVVSSAGLGLDALGDRPVVVLRAHGLTSTGETLPQAVLRAVSVHTIARLSLAVVSAGGTLVDLPADDMAELPDLGGAFNLGTAWRHELSRLGGYRE